MVLHHHPLSELTNYDLLGLTLISLGLAIGSAGGIGGGSIAIPLLILLLHFSTIHAIPLGNTAVLGSSISNIIFSLLKKHPLDKHRSIIDWDVISMMEPMTMVGALIGAYLHSILPGWFTQYALVIILSITSLRMLYKGINDLVYNKTLNKNQYEVILPENDIPVTYKSVSSPDSTTYQSEDFNFSDKLTDTNNNSEITSNYYIQTSIDTISTQPSKSFEIEQAVKSENNNGNNNNNNSVTSESFLPIGTLGILILLFTGTVLINLAKGSEYITTKVFPNNSSLILTTILILYMVTIAVWLRHRVIHHYHERISNNYQLLNGEVKWNTRNSTLYPLASISAGVIAGLFGVGGGIVKAPLMIEMGIHPLVVASTSTVMIFFTAVTAASSYFVYGVLQWDYALVLFVLGIVSNIIGHTVVSSIIALYKSSSIITILLGLLIGVSALLMTLASYSSA